VTQAIDRPGTFRGKLTEWGVSETKNGFPQFIGRLSALEYYDETGGIDSEVGWKPWAEFDQEIPVWMTLYSKKDAAKTPQNPDGWYEIAAVKQLKFTLGWDGRGFDSLIAGNYSETIVLFRVEWDEYKGMKSLKVKWIDRADASPTKTLPKYEGAKLAGLTAKFTAAGVFDTTNPTPAPVKISAGKPIFPPKGHPATTARPTITEAQNTSALPSAPAASPPALVAIPQAVCPSETKESVWAAVNGPMKDVTDEKLAEIWIAEVSKINADDSKLTAEEWATVKEAVMKQTAKF
jgi:hypothetical protein